MGNKLERLKQCVTDQSDVDFYLAFRHPLNALEEEFRVYPFMITGPCSPFSDTSSPTCLTWLVKYWYYLKQQYEQSERSRSN